MEVGNNRFDATVEFISNLSASRWAQEIIRYLKIWT